jgi:serine/threonine-protein kinase
MLRHPNILEVYDVGSLPDGRPYYVMEHLEGRTLTAILEEQGRLSPAEVLALLDPVCTTLEVAHAAGIIHRDVKASNVMVVGSGAETTVKLFDFGVAKLVGSQPGNVQGLTSEGRPVGTLTIMAPEQIRGGPVDHRADIYALGVLLYRLLTGRLPFDGRNRLALTQQHLEEPAPRPSLRAPLPPAIDTVVLRCLEKRPELRYPSVKDLLFALRAAVGGVSLGRRRQPTPRVPARGVAVYAELRVDAEHGDYDAMVDHIGAVLDLVEETLRAHGFMISLATDDAVLGVRALSIDPLREAGERAAAIEAAATLLSRVEPLAGAGAPIHVSVCVHAAELVSRVAAPTEAVGGDLLHTQHWAPTTAVRGVCATRAAVAGLSGYDLEETPEGVLRVSRRAARDHDARRDTRS